MLEQLFVYLLLIFGLQSPYTKPDVLGDVVQQSTTSSQFGSLTGQSNPTAEIESISNEDEYIAVRKKHETLEESRINAREVYTSKVASLKSLVSGYLASPSAGSSRIEQVRTAIIEENNAHSVAIRFGINQVEVAEKMHIYDITPTLFAYGDSGRTQKIISVQSDIVSLVAKRTEQMSTQIEKMMDIAGIVLLQLPEHPKGYNSKEFDNAMQNSIDTILEAKDELLVLSMNRYFIRPSSKAALKNDAIKIWNTAEADLEYTYQTLKRAQHAIATVIQLQASIRNQHVPEIKQD